MIPALAGLSAVGSIAQLFNRMIPQSSSSQTQKTDTTFAAEIEQAKQKDGVAKPINKPFSGLDTARQEEKVRQLLGKDVIVTLTNGQVFSGRIESLEGAGGGATVSIDGNKLRLSDIHNFLPAPSAA